MSLWLVGVHTLKDVINVRLHVEAPGAGHIHYPDGFDERYLAELLAEEKERGEWVRSGPNETWDLAVYCEAARLRLKEARIDWSNPPSWARPHQRSPVVVVPDADLVSATVVAAQAPRPQRRVISRGI